MPKKTYSRRRADQSTAAFQCFAGSLSPVKQTSKSGAPTPSSPSRSNQKSTRPCISLTPDSPSQNTRQQRRKREGDKDAIVEIKNCCRGGNLQIEEFVGDSENAHAGLESKAKTYPQGTTFNIENFGNPLNALRQIQGNQSSAGIPTSRLEGSENVEDLLADLQKLKISREEDWNDSKRGGSQNGTVIESSKATKTKAVSAKTRSTNHKCSEGQLRTEFSAYTQPLLSLCSDSTAQTAPTDFASWADALSQFFNISKIAEASYGEVYRLSLKSKQPGLSSEDESVLKLIALKPPPDPAPNTDNWSKTKNAKADARMAQKIQAMSCVEDVASEVRLLRHLSPVPGFTNFREVRVLRGRIPRQFVRAWKQYNKNVKKSLFPDPSRKTSYGEDQLWAVVEMQDAGADVETLIERLRDDESISVFAAWDLFWSVACAVAKAEEWTGFEHRDLHLGNICVRSANSQEGSILSSRPASVDSQISIGYTGLEITLIDYTLSRADMDVSNDDVAFFDLSKDPAIFEGDAEVDYQYEIYRVMRSAIEQDFALKSKLEPEGAKDTKSVWRDSHTVTNLIWLHFVLFKLMERLPANKKRHYEEKKEVSLLERKLRKRLESLRGSLHLQSLPSGDLKRTANLIEWAVDLGWLTEKDIVGCSGVDVSGPE